MLSQLAIHLGRNKMIPHFMPIHKHIIDGLTLNTKHKCKKIKHRTKTLETAYKIEIQRMVS